jgi:signal transduction histidine kinase
MPLKNNTHKPVSYMLVYITFLWLPCLLCPCITHGQQIDSLINLLKAYPKDDSIKADYLYQIGRLAVNGSNPQLQFYGKELIRVAELNHLDLMYMRGQMMLGVSYARDVNNLDKALAAFQTALNMAESHPEPMWRNVKAKIFINIGGIHLIQKNYPLAIEYNSKAIEVFKVAKDTINLANVYRSLGLVYRDQNKLDSAIQILQLALDYYSPLSDWNGSGMTNISIGSIHKKKKEYERAISYINKGLKIGLEKHNSAILLNAYSELGDIYLAQKQWNNAKYYLTLMLQQANIIQGSNLEEAHLSLSELYKGVGRYDSAMYHLEQYQFFFKKRYDFEQATKVSELETLYQLTSSQKENELLRKENTLVRLNVFYYRAGLLFLIISLLLSALYFWRLYYKNKIIARQSLKMEQLNTALQLNNKKLEQIMQENRFLVGLLAHDLRSPLATMQLLMQNLQEDYHGENTSYFERFERAYARIDQMIRKIIQVENIDEDIRGGKPEDVDISTVVQGVVEEFSDQAALKQVQIEFFHSAPTTCLIHCDPYLLRRVIGNLLSNAIDFSAQSQTVSINLTRDATGMVQINVKDNGPGILPEDQELIFQKYFKAKQKLGGKRTSLGLGLYFVKQYVEQIGGKVSVESMPQQGTTFIISLPCSQNVHKSSLAVEPMN